MNAKIKVLLLSVNRELSPQPVYPLGLEYLRAACQEAGFETELIDCNLLSNVESELSSQVAAYQPDFILVSLRNVDSIESVNTKFYLPAAEAAISAIKAACSATVIIGGSGFSLFPEEILLQTGADYGIVGPGEGVITQLITSLSAGQNSRNCPGLVYRNPTAPDQVIINPVDRQIQASPRLERSCELIRYYWEKGGFINIQVKRGCPFRCIYCTYPILEGTTVHSRTVKNVLDEIEDLYDRHGVDKFFIVDNVFNINTNLVNDFASGILERRLKIGWTGYFTPRGISSCEIALWKSSGLLSIEFGIDTLSPQLLKRYRKDFSVADVRRAAYACAQEQLPYSLFLLVGGPGETTETLEQSIKECLSLPRAIVLMLIGIRIYPKTELEQIALKQGYIEPQQSLLAPCFYFSPDLNLEKTDQRLSELKSLSNWCILGHGWEEKQELAAMMRSRGYKGSLWELCQL